ncbi:hypothetical protein [Acutalibacter sp. 1XD8-36]|uniref:hypothetical protein n=1 Tax=Acutalibacter sp. 1XD8-36 TaxID=2320852 RepID=UPI00141254B3|nr:hypothetical protein [Acutalibacter sp. 1XD8-36]NBJ88609.1 hypothetical protein [Acutalibacter sp. 1XD8-36]
MKKKSGARRRPGNGSKLALAVVTFLNLALTLALAVMRRQETLRAIREEDRLKVLLEQPESSGKPE